MIVYFLCFSFRFFFTQINQFSKHEQLINIARVAKTRVTKTLASHRCWIRNSTLREGMMEKLCLSERARINRRGRPRRGNFIHATRRFAQFVEGAAGARESNGYSLNRISASRSLGKLQTGVFL